MIIRPRRLRTKVFGYLMYPFTSSNDYHTTKSTSISSNPYAIIPCSPTSSISSIDSSSSKSTSSEMSENVEGGSSRRESFPMTIPFIHTSSSASSSTSSSDRSSSSSRDRDKGYQHGEDDEYEYEFEGELSESTGLLGFIPMPKWSKVKEELPFHKTTSSRKSVRNNRIFLPTLGIISLTSIVIVLVYFYVEFYAVDNSAKEPVYLSSSEENATEPIVMVSNWTTQVVEIVNDPTHILIPPHELEEVQLLPPIHDRLPYDVLESYFSTGKLPSDFSSLSTDATQQPLDMVYLFVNATSPYLQENILIAETEEGVDVMSKKRHWRDNGELRGAVRSGLKGLGENVGKLHVISADWNLSKQDKINLDLDDSSNAGWRVGQIPKWLNWDTQKSTQGKIKWHFHNDIFRLPTLSNGEKITHSAATTDQVEIVQLDINEDIVDDINPDDPMGINKNDTALPKKAKIVPPTPVQVNWENEEEWKALALPNFNSFAIESRMSWLTDVSENFIALNDDMFILRSLSKSDFRHPLLGNLIRMDAGLLVDPSMTPMQLTDSGEWGALQHANELLSKRFPSRRRMYLHHLPKTQSKSILHEAVTMWKDELSVASSREFRESKRGHGDVEMAWLTTNLRIERWREALLWSWIVAKIGGEDGVWTRESKDQLVKLLDVNDGHISGHQKIIIQRADRMTLADTLELNDQAGWQNPQASSYQFSSLDGHLNLLSDDISGRCTFSLQQCLPYTFFFENANNFSATDIFTHMAFAEPACGDCLITALVHASGQRGIEAFLPSPDQVFYPPQDQKQRDWKTSEPLLPLTDDWETSDFSLKANLFPGQDTWSGALQRIDGGIELRRWCIKLLSRYTYTFASTPSRFSAIHNYGQLKSALKSVDATPDLAMFCVNDDQGDTTDGKAKRLFGGWMELNFGGEIEGLDWEKNDIEWDHPTDEEVRSFNDEFEDESGNHWVENQNRNNIEEYYILSSRNRYIQKADVLLEEEEEAQPRRSDQINRFGWDEYPAHNIPDAHW
ncbi:uncharacterized protein IL334_001641 [Kwoniella shivajii]|uniref:Stealth protein CR3 conserved region 3 domain-containing protein n=1 Tax=Kwoniella shivajii TaxID=564305 RepID=A0ABZ1CWP4_9TREE|nr:hypothetical protein IL334_001641 [Kwoniella shivajii]